MKNKHIVITAAGLLGFVFLTSWGDIGHKSISLEIEKFFNPEMEYYRDWLPYLADHSSDADIRKRNDPDEGPKHYIDIDNYPSFKENGTIPHSLTDCIEAYGPSFVDDNGYLPWATLAAFDSLVDCLSGNRIEQAKAFAADLGHYVADGHMPMHLTRNYDGQFTGNKGIHSRYEIHMINRYDDQIFYSGEPVNAVEDPESFIFNYIYANYQYVDSILIADNYAEEMANGIDTDLYYLALWERTGNMTREMFQRASRAFATLLHSAWTMAGKPGTLGEFKRELPGTEDLPQLTIRPNPARGVVKIQSNISGYDSLIRFFDTTGKLAYETTLERNSNYLTGDLMIPSWIISGLYVVTFKTDAGYCSTQLVIDQP